MAAAAAQYRRMAAAGTDQMAGAGSLITKGTNAVVQFYYAWAIEAAVISSFILQLFLILFAGIRRRHASRGVFRGIIWVPYQLAVFTTTFGLGHLSISSRPPDRQQLVALWAPLLLLHVGGPDSITAYAIDDNRLWKRQVFKFLPQVFSTSSVLYKTFSAAGGPMFPAAWLMFAVGVAKYGERVWALYQGNLSTIRKAVDGDVGGQNQEQEQPEVEMDGDGSPRDILLCAHSQFKVCKGALVDSSSEFVDSSEFGNMVVSNKWEWDKRWAVFQMEVSLLYDIMYTKSGVIHTWHGYFLRVFSPLATAAALLLFHLSAALDSHSHAVRVDVSITYALLAGAILLDIASLVSAAGSGWAYAFLHNLLQFCTSSPRQQSMKKHTGRTVVIPPDVMELVFDELERVILRMEDMEKIKSGVPRSGDDAEPSGETMQSGSKTRASKQGTSATNSIGLIKAEKGLHAVAELNLEDKDRKYLQRYIRDEIQESILIWHIATDVYLRTREGSKRHDTTFVRAIKLLSNYLMFLMVEHPTMVPGIDLRKYYTQTYKKLSTNYAGNANDDLDRLAKILAQDETVNPVLKQNDEKEVLRGNALWLATKLALKLAKIKKFAKTKVDMETFLFYMWVELLLYVSHRCSRESHAKKLSEGGELTTIVWLMAEQAGKFYIDKKLSEEHNVDRPTES
uniref:DUF4220 domain-containing protein n=1 Tax=Oryza meridionalis TaxID=40149 RepID=A0A0E0DAH6_9ORYZ